MSSGEPTGASAADLSNVGSGVKSGSVKLFISLSCLTCGVPGTGLLLSSLS